MFRVSILVLATATSFAFVDEAVGQISFGVTRQNGVVTGGGFQVSGAVLPGAMGVRLGINAGTSQLIGVQNFSFQNGASNRSAAPNASVARRPSAGQFIKAAKRFDVDKDERLSEEELKNVGVAVVAELQRRRSRVDPAMALQQSDSNSSNTAATADEMVQSFVKRCLTFDKDSDDALNSAETKRMATAFIRSL